MTFDRQGSRIGFAGWLLFLALLNVCGAVGEGVDAKDNEDLEQLAGCMAGAFSSERQAERDPSFYDVRLKMAPIWTDRGDGHWFYVEQVMYAHLGRPYRQRVYHLTEPSPGLFRSDVYTMENPRRFVGAWSRRNPMARLTPDSLELRDGCEIHLHRVGSSVYRGGTAGKSCRNSRRGASYATSELLVTKHLIASWDRGFDVNGRQVWGAVTGPYSFDKIVDWSDRLEAIEAVSESDGEPDWGRSAGGGSR